MMRKANAALTALAAAAAGGVIIGPSGLQAQAGTDHRVVVGLATNAATIVTPWHNNETDTRFYGLDLVKKVGDTAGTKVYWESHHSVGSGSRRMKAYVYDHTRSGTKCTGVDVELYDALDNRFLGEEHYVHIKATDGVIGTYFYVEANESWTARELGTVVASQPEGCPFQGPHLHQSGADRAGLNTFFTNWALDDGYPSDPYIDPVMDFDNHWMHKATWS